MRELSARGILTPSLAVVSDGSAAATYSYLANSPLVQQIAFTHDSTTVMNTERNYDYLNRLTSINSQPSTINSFLDVSAAKAGEWII